VADGVLCMWDMIVVAGSVHIASCMRLRRLQARTLNLASDIKSGMECVCVCVCMFVCVYPCLWAASVGFVGMYLCVSHTCTYTYTSTCCTCVHIYAHAWVYG
jgi:hypothetical protein